MSKKGSVYFNDIFAGILEQSGDTYTFTYDDEYFNNPDTQSIAVSLPKTKKIFRSSLLFPFFFGLLAEGTDKLLQCRTLKIDEHDHFTRLLKTASRETIGAVTVREAE